MSEKLAEIGALAQFTPATQASIFRVLQEQFGLRLAATRAPVEVWVIVRAEKPSENQGSALGFELHTHLIRADARRSMRVLAAIAATANNSNPCAA